MGNQRGILVLWAAVDTDAKEKEQHLITLVTTGSALPDIQNADFLGTVLFNYDSYVVHLFHEKV
ncbi:hypothetical protein K2Q31_15845 [Alkalihalobacillus clausii]|nr:hypothetical protein [Shouchella clausii]MBX0320114.1 hypothetical protein [Shouchella clausii]